MKLLVGLTGKSGCGKETFYREGFFRDALFANGLPTNPTVKVFSDILAKIARAANLLPSRENLIKLPQMFKSNFPGWTLANAMAKDLEEESSEIVIVDGVRWPEDLEMVRRFARNLLVYITVRPELRFERMRKRNKKPGEGEMSLEKFLQEDGAPTEIHIETIGATADFTIDNNGSLEVYRAQVEHFVITKAVPIFNSSADKER